MHALRPPATARRRRRRRRRCRRRPRTSAAPPAGCPPSAPRRSRPRPPAPRASSRVSGKLARTRSMSCSAASTVRFSACQCRTSASRSAEVLASMALNGSSSTITRASCNSTRANSMRCICPPDSVPMGRFSNPLRPTAASACAILSRCGLPMPPNTPVRAPQPGADEIEHRDRKAAVDIRGLRQIGDVADVEVAKAIEPASGFRMPTMPRNSVDLPAPFGPTTASSAPAATSPLR